MPIDLYRNLEGTASGPATRLRAVSPHDDNDLEYVASGLFIGGAGTIAVIARNDASPVTLTVQAGQLLPIRAKRVRATGTTATGIVALIS